jgi:hypothetical protein
MRVVEFPNVSDGNKPAEASERELAWRSPQEVGVKANVGADTLKPYFSAQHLLDIQEKFQRIEAAADRLLLQYVSYPFKNGLAKEYANHGFGRRVGTLRRCIENVFKIVPPETAVIPARSTLHDTQINIQAFVANVYGAITQNGKVVDSQGYAARSGGRMISGKCRLDRWRTALE